MKNIVQRILPGIAAVAILASISGCSKDELSSAPSNGVPKSVGYFLRVVDNGVPVPNYTFSINCGPDLTTGSTGLVAWGGGCSTFTDVSVDAECFQTGVWYYLKPPGSHAARKYLKFRFAPGFSSTGVQLIGYNVATLSWVLTPGIPGFQAMMVPAKTTLPLCH